VQMSKQYSRLAFNFSADKIRINKRRKYLFITKQ
jgi:hypothetical protein